MNERIKEVFGNFGVQIKGKVEIFSTLEEAEQVLADNLDEEIAHEEAGKFAEFLGFAQGTKGYNGKVNVIVSYLNWVSEGRPEPELEEATEEATEEDSEY